MIIKACDLDRAVTPPPPSCRGAVLVGNGNGFGLGVSQVLPMIVSRTGRNFSDIAESPGLVGQLSDEMRLPCRRVDLEFFHRRVQWIDEWQQDVTRRMRADQPQLLERDHD